MHQSNVFRFFFLLGKTYCFFANNVVSLQKHFAYYEKTDNFSSPYCN